MSRRAVLIIAVAGMLVGVAGAGLAVTALSARLQPPLAARTQPPATVITSCDVPLSYGPVKVAWGEWLLFEDDGGVLRAVDGNCAVRQTIRRQ